MSKTGSRSITFQHAFLLSGMDKPHAAGTFEVLVEEEPIDVSWEAYRTRMTIMLTSGGRTEAWPVTNDDLEAALALDRQTIGNGGSP